MAGVSLVGLGAQGQHSNGGLVAARVERGAQTLADRGIDQDADEDGAGSGYVSWTWSGILDQPAPSSTRIHASSEQSLHPKGPDGPCKVDASRFGRGGAIGRAWSGRGMGAQQHQQQHQQLPLALGARWGRD